MILISTFIIGYGIFSKFKISKGDFILEYKGMYYSMKLNIHLDPIDSY